MVCTPTVCWLLMQQQQTLWHFKRFTTMYGTWTYQHTPYVLPFNAMVKFIDAVAQTTKTGLYLCSTGKQASRSFIEERKESRQYADPRKNFHTHNPSSNTWTVTEAKTYNKRLNTFVSDSADQAKSLSPGQKGYLPLQRGHSDAARLRWVAENGAARQLIPLRIFCM